MNKCEVYFLDINLIDDILYIKCGRQHANDKNYQQRQRD